MSEQVRALQVSSEQVRAQGHPFVWAGTRGLFGAIADDVEVALREGYGDVVAVEGVVDGFLDAAGEEVFFLDVHPDVDEEVDAAVAEVGEGDGDGVADGLQGLDEETANVVDVSAVGDADG